jgi:hypothetical protein
MKLNYILFSGFLQHIDIMEGLSTPYGDPVPEPRPTLTYLKINISKTRIVNID